MVSAPLRESHDPTPVGLLRLGVQQPLSSYFREIWRRREFAWDVPIGELRSQHMNTVLGNVWHLLNPLLLLAVYFLIFGVVLEVSRGVDNFLAFLAIGVFLFHYTQRTVIAGAKSIVRNEALIRSITFPRALLPLSSAVEQTLAFVPACLVMILFAIVSGERVTAQWLLLAPILVGLMIFNLGGALIAARVTNSFRDFENVLPFVFRILFYASGILYSIQDRVSDPRWIAAFAFNPVYAYVTLARGAIMGLPVSPVVILSAMLWTLALVTGGFVYFRAGEQEYGRA